MRYLEVRRHTMRNKPGKHLSQEGVTLARRVGEQMGPFARVITSDLPRAMETAIAMGFAFDERLDDLSEMSDAIGKAIEHATSLAAFGRAIRQNAAVARYAEQQANLWRAIARALPDEGSALVISHGMIMELGAVGCLPKADHTSWGATFSYCEGIRLSFESDQFVAAEILRVP